MLLRTKILGGSSILIEAAKRSGLDAQYINVRHEVQEFREPAT